MREYDIIIVGGGFAGLSSAFFSKYYDKENKLKVLLIENLNKEKYEKYHKMCGCIVSRKLFEEIKPIKLKIIGKIKKQIEIFPNNIEVETKVNGCTIDRVNSLNEIKENFLEFGGEFLNCSLVDFVQKNEIKIKLSNGNFIKTKYLIDCSGANSIVRKKLGIKAKTETLFQYLIDKNPMKETIIFEYDEKYKGNYKWIFPYGNFMKIGLPFNFKVKEKVIEKHVRTIAFGGLKKYVYGNILFCGESGCQTNAITKGGIRIAMNSGKLCAFAFSKNSPILYEKEFKKTNFDNEIFLRAFNKFKKMKNEELAKIGEKFREETERWQKENGQISKISKSKKQMKEIHDNFSVNEYSKLSKAFILSQQLGW